MPTPEEIKKIAREYALKNCTALVSAGRIYFIVNDFIEHLSKGYCIMPKSKIKEWESIVEDALKADQVITEPAFRFMWERIFGKSLFNEGKG